MKEVREELEDEPATCRLSSNVDVLWFCALGKEVLDGEDNRFELRREVSVWN